MLRLKVALAFLPIVVPAAASVWFAVHWIGLCFNLSRFNLSQVSFARIQTRPRLSPPQQWWVL